MQATHCIKSPFFEYQVRLGWLYLLTGVLIGSAVIPIVLAVIWKGVKAKGMMLGALVGSLFAIIMWQLVAASLGGDFYDSTGKY